MNRIDGTQYRLNWRLWWRGWWRFRELEPYRRPFGTWSPVWWLAYLLDFGSHVACGGAVTTWSRWSYDERTHAIAGGLNRFLNRLDKNHGRDSMPPLWGSRTAWR